MFACRFFRRSAFYDTEAYILDVGLLYEATASVEENLSPYESFGKTVTCVTASIQDVHASLNPDKNTTAGAIESVGSTHDEGAAGNEEDSGSSDTNNSSSNSGAHCFVKRSLVMIFLGTSIVALI